MVFGGGSSNDVEIKVKVDDSGVITTFDKLGNELSKVEKSADDANKSFSAIDSGINALKLSAGLATAALAAFGAAAAVGIASIRRGSEVDDISESFKKLSQEAGVAGDVLLNKLNSAVGNTISNFDLMKQSNELLLGGINPDQFELLAKAARSIGEATGKSAKEGMEALSDSLLRGNDRALKTLGIVIDNNKALDDFAKKLGVSADKLSEEGKVLALREASLQALAEQQSRLGEVTDDASDKLDQFNKYIGDAKDSFVSAIANNKELNNALSILAEAVKKINFEELAKSIAAASTVVINFAAGAIPALIEQLNWLARVIAAIPAEIDNFIRGLKEIERIIGGPINAMREFAAANSEASQAAKDRVASDENQIKSVKTLNSIYDAAGKKISEYGDAARGAFNDLKYFTEVVGPKQFIGPMQEQIKLVPKSTANLIANGKGASEAGKKLEDLAKANGAFNDSIKKLLGQEALPGVSRELENIFLDLKQGLIQTSEAERQIRDLSRAYSDTPESLKRFSDAMADSEKSAEDFEKQLTELAENPWTTEIIEQAEQVAQDFNDAMSATLGQGLGDVLVTALKGGDIRNAISAIGGDIGGQIGSSIGAAVGGPFGEAFGGAIGQAFGDKLAKDLSEIGKSTSKTGKGIFTAIDSIMPGLGLGLDALIGDKLFGGDSQGTQTRKAIDKFFADAFDANRLMVIIDNELKQITDLDLGGGLFGDTDSGAGQFFSGLSESAQAAFTGVASGFTTLLGVGQEAAQGLAIALSDNLGGSLNNLQLLVQASGVSFEQLRESAVNAFLDGKLSALEAQSALSAIANIAQDGIPDGIGFTVQAFENLQAAGSKGGRALIDALKDIGFEARELGIRDFGGLIANITASGQFSQQEIEQVFNTLRENGINSIDELVNATNEQLIPTLASLEAQGFLTEASNETAALIDSINQIPEEKNLTVNVKTNFDNNTIAANNAGIFSLPSNSIN